MYGYQRNLSKLHRNVIALFLFFSVFVRTNAQDTILASRNISEGKKTVIAGKQYGTGSFHQWLWGRHYRKEWITPVTVPTLNLDSIDGGLVAYEAGGGRQSKTLRLKNPQGKEYVLRSIDKTLGKTLPENVRSTFVEKIIDDQVSIAHPYAAVTVPGMAKAAQIYHCNPMIIFIPEQKALGEFNRDFANDLYLLEQRADGDWSEEANFGNSSEIINTEKLLEKLREETDRRIDQQSYIRARLFDMFVGDWGRHEDQWRWATLEENGKKIYRPIPRDRDQVYTKFDGLFVSVFKKAAGAGHVETFRHNIDEIKKYNYSARNLDRQAANETTLEQWISTARELQQLLTNEIIDSSVRQLPPEVFPISGPEIISKLKSRRDHLVDFAEDYYRILAKEVEIVGTKKRELFEIEKTNEGKTVVRVYDLSNEGERKTDPFYSRAFSTRETNEIRLYGLSENDEYVMKGEAKRGVKVRIIGGPDKDIYNDSLLEGRKHNIKIYDNANNDFRTSAETKLYLSERDAIHEYKYDAYNDDSRGVKKILFFSNEDRIHVGVGYQITDQKWRKIPYGSRQEVNVKYSLNENAFSTEYKGLFIEAVGKWNLALYGNYDWIRWINYFGVGNTSKREITDRKDNDYYRMRTRQLLFSAGINRAFARHHVVSISGVYQTYDVVQDEGRYVAEHPTNANGGDYAWKNFAGGRLDYTYLKANDPILPTKGVRFSSSVSYTADIKESDKSFARFFGALTFYVPLSKSFVYAIKVGGATLTGTPEFYQLNVIGGGQTLRGYRRFRFYGKTSFFGQNELQWIRPVRSNLFNGKAGLLALVDIGRVWQPGEDSRTMHTSAGFGFILAPFNTVSVAATYAKSREDATVNFRFFTNF
jgi:hypothetical protein